MVSRVTVCTRPNLGALQILVDLIMHGFWTFSLSIHVINVTQFSDYLGDVIIHTQYTFIQMFETIIQEL